MFKILILLGSVMFCCCQPKSIEAQNSNSSNTPENTLINFSLRIPSLTVTDYKDYKLIYNVDYDGYYGDEYTGFLDPEEVVWAYISAANDEWLKQLYVDTNEAPELTKEVKLNRLRDLEFRNDNFLILEEKVSFLYKGKEFHLIKAKEFQDSVFVNQKNFVITKHDGKLKIETKPPERILPILDFYSHIKRDIRLKLVRKATPSEEETLLFEVHSKTRSTHDDFSISKFLNLVDKWKTEKDTSKINYFYDVKTD